MRVTHIYLSNSIGLEGTVSHSCQLEKFRYPHAELLMPGIGLHGCGVQIVACSALLPSRPDEAILIWKPASFIKLLFLHYFPF